MSTVLITGASSGFGREAAIELARRGWRVFATMRNPERGEALKAALRDCAVEGSVEIIALDVTDGASVARAADLVVERAEGAPDVLVNNAGYSIFGAFEDLPDEECRAQMETNFFGALNVTRAFLPAMRAAGRGRIITVTSNAVNSPHPMLTMYAASKWALEGWAEGLAMELAPFGIEVAVVQPGAHRTEFASNVRFVQAEGSVYAPMLERAGPGIANLDRWGRPPRLGALALVEAVCAERIPFRQQIGEDAEVFAALRNLSTFEVRALILRAIVGLPGRTGPVGASAPLPVWDEVLRQVLAGLAGDPAAAATIARAFAGGSCGEANIAADQ